MKTRQLDILIAINILTGYSTDIDAITLGLEFLRKGGYVKNQYLNATFSNLANSQIKDVYDDVYEKTDKDLIIDKLIDAYIDSR